MQTLLSRPVLSLLLGAAMAIVGAVIGNDMLLGAGIGLAGGGNLPNPQAKK